MYIQSCSVSNFETVIHLKSICNQCLHCNEHMHTFQINFSHHANIASVAISFELIKTSGSKWWISRLLHVSQIMTCVEILKWIYLFTLNNQC